VALWLPSNRVRGTLGIATGRGVRCLAALRRVDLVVTVDEQAHGPVLMDRARMSDALLRGQVRLDGAPDLVKGFPRWLGPSHFARYATAS
jgi:hypothetical protein